MATVERKPPIGRGLPALWQLPAISDFTAPGWLRRLPAWLTSGVLLVALITVSTFIRTREIGGQLWSDEANTVGIASHPLGAIPGILRAGGGAPLYYVLLHLWIQVFGTSEAAVHALSLVLGAASIPVAMWAGWSLFGRRAGYMAAALVSFNAWLTVFAAEARMYELVLLLALVCTASLVHAFVFGRQRYAWGFAASLALMLYAEPWCLLFAAACGAALVVCWLRGEDRATVARSGAASLALALLAYVPWLPTLIHQAANATAPWHYAPVLGANFPRALVGSDRVTALFAIALLAGCVPLLARERRRSREATAVLSLIVIVSVAALLALMASLFVPAWAIRYLGPLVAPLMILVAFSCARSGIVGLAVVLISCAFLANAASFIPKYKSDMKDVSGELAPQLRAGDVVLMGQPEQTPLAWYYLPAGLRFATVLGPDPHPSYMNWDNAYTRLLRANPARTLDALVASLPAGGHLLYVRPLTDGRWPWLPAWAQLVRRRSAQLGALLTHDRNLLVVPGGWAPHTYRGSCCIASSALLFVKR